MAFIVTQLVADTRFLQPARRPWRSRLRKQGNVLEAKECDRGRQKVEATRRCLSSLDEKEINSSLSLNKSSSCLEAK